MRSLVVYDSQFGNTKLVAERIGSTLETSGRVLVMPALMFSPVIYLESTFGGWFPNSRIYRHVGVINWINIIPRGGLEGIKAAAFDTRFTEEEINKVKILSFFVNIFGYAAKPISDKLEKKGAKIVLPPEGFYVAETEGPLLEQELERAVEWIKHIST